MFIRNHVRSACKPTGPAHILNLSYDGHYDYDLAKTGHVFYTLQSEAVKPWSLQCDSQENNIFLSAQYLMEMNDLSLDFILCHDRITQYKTGMTLSRGLHIPLVLIDHAGIHNEFSNKDIHILKTTRHSDISVGCHPSITKQWNNTITCNECAIVVTQEVEKTNDVLLYGNFIHSECARLRELLDSLNCSYLWYGNNKGFSTDFDNQQSLQKAFASSKICLHLSIDSSLSNTLKQAMSHKCSIIINTTDIAEEMFLGQESVLFIRTLEDIPARVNQLLANASLRDKLTTNAYQIAIDNFNEQIFIDTWNDIIDQARRKVYYR